MKFLNSSAIAQQIEQGFPCDVVIVADNKWQNFLIERNLVDSHSKIFARNNLILAKNNSQTIFLTLEKLISKHEKIIVADPDYVPLGSYTKSALVTLGLFKQLEKNFIKAHSAQVARLLLKEGAANFAFLYASDVDNKNIFQATFIDAKLHPPIIYPLLQCKKSQKNHAHLLNSFLMSDEMQKILKNNGFGAAREQ